MFKSSHPILAAALLLIIASSVLAQQTQPSVALSAKLQHRQVLASASGGGLRFSALGELLQMRLEVIGPAGDVVFDSQVKPGNVIDWRGVDAQGQRLSNGTYLCMVTVKDADGKETKRQAIAVLVEQQMSLKQCLLRLWGRLREHHRLQQCLLRRVGWTIEHHRPKQCLLRLGGWFS